MGRPPKNWNNEPQRVESPARMTVAEEAPVAQEPAMRVAASPTEADLVRGYELVKAVPPLHPVQSDPEVLAMFPDGVIPPPESTGRPWHPIEVAHQDGTLLEALGADGSEFMMVWRRTSRFNAKAGKWEHVGFWSSHLSREPLKVEPVSWRMPEGFAMPGMVVA